MNYNSVKKTETRPKTDTVCMRENPFYVDTVRDFRDRIYEFKKIISENNFQIDAVCCKYYNISLWI